MNVLVYVLVMVAAMLLSVTARIPSTLTGVQISKAYAEEMKLVESQELWNAVQKSYDREHVSEPESDFDSEEEEIDHEPELNGEGNRGGPLHRRLSIAKAVKNFDSVERRVFKDLLQAGWNRF